MLSAALYAHVRTSFPIAHETAGAARTRHSLRPLFSGAKSFQQTSGATRRENANVHLSFVIPGRAKHEPGIHRAAELVDQWIPGSALRAAPE